MYGNNTAIFITKLTLNGVAEMDGRLKPNDILCKVNDVDCTDVDHSDAVQALKEAGQTVTLVSISTLCLVSVTSTCLLTRISST